MTIRQDKGHTPGKWRAVRMHTGGFDIMDPRDRDVVTLYGGGVEQESLEANARLIAAAPDLLEAGEGLLQAYRVLIDRIADDEFDIAAEHPASWASRMEAAIARATGASQ